MKEEEPWATLLKNTRLVKNWTNRWNRKLKQAFWKTQGGNWSLIRMFLPSKCWSSTNEGERALCNTFEQWKVIKKKNVLLLGIGSYGNPFENPSVDNCYTISTFNRNSVTTIYPVCWFSNNMGTWVNGNPFENQHNHIPCVPGIKQQEGGSTNGNPLKKYLMITSRQEL